MTRSNSDESITEVLRAMGLMRTEVRQYSNRLGTPTGLKVVSIHDWDHRQHPPISEIARRLPANWAVEIVLEPVGPDATWMPRRHPDPWSASMMRGRRR